MLSFLSKRTTAFFFTALIIVPMFFLLPVTITPKHTGVSIAQAYWCDGIPGCGALAFSDDCGLLWWRCAARDLAELLLVKIPAFFFGLAGIVFDTLVAFSLSSTVIKNQDFVNQGWVIMRDLSNTFFIFILLYIAISTILQLAGGQTKRLLATLVVVALLMNFSLYITKFIIDLGNVFALEFYVNMGVTGQSYITLQDIEPRSISKTFSEAFSLQTLLGQNFLNEAAGNLPFATFIFALVGIMYLVAAFVFLSAAFLFLARVVAFWLLMILSPLAFFSAILPYTSGKIWRPWLSQLMSQSFFAPIFLFFVYLDLIFAGTVKNLFKPGIALAGANMGYMTLLIITFLTFFTLITVLLFGLKTAKSMSGGIGESMLKIGGAATGASVGVTGAIARNSVGRMAQWASNTYGDKWKQSRMGQLYLSGTDKLAKSSFDARGSKMVQMAQTTVGGVNLGSAGGEGGYTKIAANNAAANKKMCDSLKNDPAAFAKCIANLKKVTDMPGVKFNGVQQKIPRMNPDRDAMEYWSTLSTRERQEAKAAATGANKTYLESLDSKLTGGFKEKQLKAEEKGKRAFSAENAKDTIEEFEGFKTRDERELYVNQLINGNPLKNIPGLDKEHRLALYKNMTAAQRAEAKGLNDKIFKDISDSDLTREELSRITGQDRKYKIEDMAKAAQKERAANIEKLVRDNTRTDTEQQKAEIKDIVDKMRGNELAELEESLLTNDLIIPHIQPKHIQKIEKEGYNISQGSMETLYKKIKQTNPKTQAYIENREFGEIARGAQRRFQGGRDNRAGNSN